MDTQKAVQNVLVTGAYGLIGNLVYARLAQQPERYNVFGTSRRPRPSERAEPMDVYQIPEDRLRIADLMDFEAMQQAVAGMDEVIHMAADPSGIPVWESVLQNNIIGSYHVFEACRLAGVSRVLYASSNQVSFGYRDQEPFTTLISQSTAPVEAESFSPIIHTQPTRPLNLYACSKVFGESLAHMYAYTHGMSCIVLRIGWVMADDTPPEGFGRAVWCSRRDCVQLVELALNAPDSLRFDVFYVQSDNPLNFVDISHAREVLGYNPQDSIVNVVRK